LPFCSDAGRIVTLGNRSDILHWTYGVAAAILGGLIAFVSIYPQNHFLALMIFAAALSLVAIYELYIVDFSLSEIAVCIIPLFGFALLAYYVVGPNLPAETETHGWLVPANLPLPTTNCTVSDHGLMFIAGSNVTTFDSPFSKAALLTLDSTHLISVERQGNKLSFDVDLFDEDGNIAVKIIRDEFHLMSNSKFAYRERSDDLSEITVYDNKDQEILYIKYENPSTVILRGVFHSSDRALATITNDAILLHGHPSVRLAQNCARNMAFTLNTVGFNISPFSPAPSHN
jgi:hypothetical protein